MPDDLRPTWCGREATSRQCCCHTRAILSIKPRMFDVSTSPTTDIHRRGGYVSFVPKAAILIAAIGFIL